MEFPIQDWSANNHFDNGGNHFDNGGNNNNHSNDQGGGNDVQAWSTSGDDATAGGVPWSSDGFDNFGDLCKQIKDIQKTNPVAKEQWIKFTTKKGGGKRDPARHHQDFLRDFLTTLTVEMLQGGENSDSVLCGDPNLVAQIKEMQRTDSDAKEQWHAYTQTVGDGNRDPARHTAEFIHGFIQARAEGRRFEVQAPPDISVDLIPALKMLQKKSGNFRTAWAAYCSQQGWGVNDPAKHEAFYHVKFFDFLMAKFNDNMGLPVCPPIMEEGSAKRARTDGGKGGSSWNQGEDDGRREELVTQVKNFQRKGEAQKELWEWYADTQLGGTRDPARHEPGVLQDFMWNHASQNS